MKHILTTSKQELKTMIDFLESYTFLSLKDYILFCFWKGFKSSYQKLAHLKESLLLEYSSMLSDIQKDVQNPDINIMDIENSRKSILYITETIQDIWDILFHIIPKSTKQEDILSHEKRFFLLAVSSLQNDIKKWLEIHMIEIDWVIQELESQSQITSLQEWKAVLQLQKKRLQWLKNTSSPL